MEKENIMGTMSTKKLLLEMSLPIMVSMLIQALYNIVDSYFVSQINENAFTAVSMAFPIQNIMLGIGVGTGVGIKALLSRSLGEKNYKKLNLAAENALILCFFHGFILFLVGLFVPKIYYESQARSFEIINYGIGYTKIVTMASLGMFFQLSYERILQSTGKTKLSMYAQLIGAVINIILDPILIFGLFGFPALGVNGAAIATVIGQIIGAALGYLLNKKLNPEIQIRGLHIDFKIINEIYKVGIPSVILITITSLVVYFLNIILGRFSPTAVAALGAYFKIQSFIFMPVFGLNNGMVPIIAYNYGARKKDRVLETIDFSIKIGFLVAIIGLIIFQLFPVMLLKIFNASDQLIKIGVPAIKIISLSFVFVSYNFVINAVFQSLGNGLLALVSSLLRQIVVLLPVALLLSLFGKLEYIWFCFPVSEIVGFIFSKHYLKQFAFNKINEC